MESVSLFYGALMESDLSRTFAMIMSGFFIVVSVTLFFPALSGIPLVSTFHRLYRRNPNILMNVGIFGTFFGICIALLHFDDTNIDASVPGLLSGMKLAFATSVLGVGLSILLHLLDSAGNGEKVDAGISPVEAILREMERSRKEIVEELGCVVKNGNESAHRQTEQNRKTVEALEKLQKSLTGEDDASLATCLLHMRQDARDGRKKLEQILTDSFNGIRAELAEFGKTLAESNSRALLEALREVIKDFNTKLTEEFGENFKELNRAVGDLLAWQENYRESIGEMQGQFQRCLEGVILCEESLRSIRDHAERIPVTMETLSSLLQGLEQQNARASELLESFAHMREQAGDALPVIQRELTAMTQELSNSVRDTGKTVAVFTKEAAEKIASTVTGVSESLETSNKLFADRLNESVERTTDELTNSVRKAREAVEQNARNLENTLDEALQKTRELMNRQFQTLDSTMERELEKVIGQLGSHLTSLSAKFVEDYTPLTNKLAEVVRICEKMGDNSRGISGSGEH